MAGLIREACGVRPACRRCGGAGNSSAFDSAGKPDALIVLPKLFTGGEESSRLLPRSQLRITLAAAKKCLVNNSQFCSISGSSTQGPEDELRTPTSRRLYGEFRSETLRLVAKEYSEPFACKYKLGRDEPL